MAFPAEPIRTPTAIGAIEVQLYDPVPESDETPRAIYKVQVIYQDGTARELRGNLVPHLTQTQINALLSFMADMRTKANAEILPE